MYKGEIANFPVEIVEKMLEYQELRGWQRNVDVFEKYKCAEEYGFDWENTEDGDIFWEQVIVHENFDLFFEKYPKVNPTTQMSFMFSNMAPEHIMIRTNVLNLLSVENMCIGMSDDYKVFTFSFKTEYLPLVMQVVERMNLTIVNDTLTSL